MMTNLKRVEAFIEAWNRRDARAVSAAFADQAVYHNVPMQPVVGAARIRDALSPFIARADHIDWIIHHIAEASDGTVLTERTDRFDVQGGRMVVRVMGVFEFADGEIIRWRDYFDPAEMRPAG